jgi:hypothetical protein
MNPSGRTVACTVILVGAALVFTSGGGIEAQAPDKPPELKVLDRFIGKWKFEMVLKPAEWTPKEIKRTGTSVNEWVLDGWFQQHKVKTDGGTESIEMLTYDPRMKTYRTWFFGSDSFANEVTGAWDEKAKIFASKGNMGNGVTTVETMRFIDDDNREGQLIAKDAAGKTVLDIRVKLTRQK